jgi:hypothetical protein
MDMRTLRQKIESLDPKAHKALREALNAEYNRLAGEGPEAKPENEPVPGNTKALMSLSLSEFEQGTYVVKVRSHLLREDIYFVSNERLFDRVPDGFVVYTAKELRALKGSTKDDIKNVHRIKRIFNGEIIS